MQRLRNSLRSRVPRKARRYWVVVNPGVNHFPRLPISKSRHGIRIVKLLASLLALAVLAGCAQLQTDATRRGQAPAQPASTNVVDFVIPADALGARDPQLTEVLGKVGALAAKQPQATTVVIAALAQDFPYLNQAVQRGIPARHGNTVNIENVTTGSCQPYSVQVKPTE